jgi:acyl-CoA synthetase (AMP-forming)/AMP-acid ligase II
MLKGGNSSEDASCFEQVCALLVLEDGTSWSGHGLLPSAAQQRSHHNSPGDRACDGAAAAVHEARLSEERVKSHCRQQGLSSFMIPHLVLAQYDVLPANASGKVLKHVVRERVIGWLSQERRVQSRL